MNAPDKDQLVPSHVSPLDSTGLSKEMRVELWARVNKRLQAGEVMTQNRHFAAALVEEFCKFARTQPSEQISEQIHAMVDWVNRKHPETYLNQGMQNGIKQAFERGIRQLNWDISKLQAMGTNAMRRFFRQQDVSELLLDCDIYVDQIDLADQAIRIIRNLTNPDPRAAAHTDASGDSGTKADQAIQAEGADAAAATPPTVREAYEKIREEIFEQRLAKNSQDGASQQAESPPRPTKLTMTNRSEDPNSHGKSENKEAVEHNPNLSGVDPQSDKNETKNQADGKAPDPIADYLRGYQALQRINSQCDEALRFLIHNKMLVTADRLNEAQAAASLAGLKEDEVLLGQLVDIMGCKDEEIRKLSERLPPYAAIAGPGLQRIKRMTIEKEFVDQLRPLDEAALSEQLHSPEKAVALRPVADMLCFISLVDHLIKNTPFRKEVQLVQTYKRIEQFFLNNSDTELARHQAERFLEQQLQKLFPNLSVVESNEVKHRCWLMIDDIEKSQLAKRREAVEARRKRDEEAAALRREKAASKLQAEVDDVLELSADEQRQGVQIARIEMQVGRGGTRRIPFKVMPDEDDPSRFVVVQPDPDTGELVPQLQRGKKRLVEKAQDGMWRPVKG